MSSEILTVLEYMEKEKGISRGDMIAAIIGAIKNAALKGVNAGQELKIDINPRNGQLHAWSLLKVVDSISDPKCEIHLEKARLIKPGAQLGEIIEKEIDPSFLGRIAAQTARQAIMQKLRQFEKERIYDDFKDVVGDVVSGIVRRRERSDLFVDLGKAEAMLPHKEQVPGEEYSPGERIRCLLLAIENTNRGPELILSRASPKFVRRLFELEVTEIADGTVKIEAFAREPGYRTKISVSTSDPKVDPVGACVGARGARVKSIVRELGGEKIDIIRHYEDPQTMVLEALKPVVPRSLEVDAPNRRIKLEMAEADLALAIGRKGQNARLTSRLIGWKVDILREKAPSVGIEERQHKAAGILMEALGVDEATALLLVNAGFISMDIFADVGADDLVEAGISREQADGILAKVRNLPGRETAG